MNEVIDEAVARISARIGFRVDLPMRNRLEAHLTRTAAESGVSLGDFVAGLVEDGPRWHETLDAVTVRETSFFRDPAQLAAFADNVLPLLVEPIRIWCAGCSHGQEAYSLAMLLEEAGRVDAKVVATDISSAACARTTEGRYDQRELRGLSPERRERHLRREGDRWAVSPELRARVDVVRHNLVTEAPPLLPGSAQVVFCRNVLIYFRPEVIRATLTRWSAWLPPGGYLFLGFSESLWQVSDAYVLERLGDSFAYRRPLHPPYARPVPTPRAEPVRKPPGRVRPPEPAARRQAVATAPPAGAELSPEAEALLAEGELALAGEEAALAVTLFRKAAYLSPAHPVPHLQLGLALEASGDGASARRAFLACRAALARSESGQDVQGYRAEALHVLLDEKLGRDAR